MSMLGRLFAACSLIGLVLMAASVACPECLAALGLDFADFSEQLNSLAQASERGRELDEQMNGIVARRTGQEHLTRELIAGRRTLAETMARLRTLLEADTQFWGGLRRFQQAGSDDERLGRYAIAWARFVLENDNCGEQAVALGARLEQELQDQLADHAAAAQQAHQ